MVGNFRTHAGMVLLGLTLCLVYPAGAKVNTALAFNGLNTQVDAGTAVIPASGDYTVEFSYYCPAAAAASQTILSQGNLFYIGSDAANNLRVGDNWQPPGVTLPVGGWHHLALVQSSTNTILYLDGTNWVSRGSSLGNPGATSFRLGCQSGANAEFWRGSLDDVRVWNVARGGEEIRTNRFVTLTGTETGLVADWQLDEGRGTNLTAIGSGQIKGALLHGPRWVPGWVWTPNVQWVGGNPLAQQIHTAFTDPGLKLTTPWAGIAAGTELSLALKADGTVVTWGNNNYGQTNTPAAATNIVAVAGGQYHSLALKADGSVLAWGFNNNGQTQVPNTATNIVAIAAGVWYSLALKADGTVVAWGWRTYGQTNVPASATNVVAIAAGGYHGLALKADGTVVAWGANTYGQTNVPTSATNVVAIAAGESHSLALKADGTVVVWGADGEGQTNVPATVTNVVAIAAGGSYSLALKADGSVVRWGHMVGAVPAAATNVVAIAAGWSHSLALKADGTIVTWGSYSYGLQNVPVCRAALLATSGSVNTEVAGTYTLTYSFTNDFGAVISTNRTVVVVVRPVIVSQPVKVTALAGSSTQLSVVATGTPPLNYQWYREHHGAVAGATEATLAWSNLAVTDAGIYYVVVRDALGSVGSCRALVAPLNWQWTGGNPLTNLIHTASIDPGATLTMPVVAIAGGGFDNLALQGDGRVVAWGNNGSNQTNVPVSATNIVAFTTGGMHCLALKAEGSVFGWGDNDHGQLNVPATVVAPVALAAGGYNSLALLTDGTLVAWGANFMGQTDVPASATNIVAIALGVYHCLALKADGTVVAWGSTADVAVAATNVVAIAAGVFHSLALKADGSVVAWGRNDKGVTNVPASVVNVVAIAGSLDHSLALKADGTVVAWGDNTYGETSVPATATNIVAIAASYHASLALKADGTVVGWGDNTYGQTNAPAFTQTLLAVSSTVNTGVAGTYTLTYSFTNSSGAVLTTNRTVVVAEAVHNPPILANLARVGEGVGFTLSGDSGQTVVIETCTNLAAPVWVPVQTNVLGGIPVNFSAPVQREQPGQFYRLRTP